MKKLNISSQQSKPPSIPAIDSVIEQDVTSPRCDQKRFLSLVMSLLYLGRFTRPDILFATTVLATRSSSPTDRDMSNALRIVRYLAGTPTIGLCFKADSTLQPAIFADASHCIHPDGRGQGGITITLGSSPIFSRSYKLKLTTRSSSESELVTLEEASTYPAWLNHLLQDMGIKTTPPMTIFQDNKSSIILAIQGATFKRTKHLLCKESYITERIAKGEVKLQYLPTKDMPADMLTKVLSGPKQKRCMDLLYIR
eukprot:scaffold5545_cov170-Ochromonas_danica.AAC.1